MNNSEAIFQKSKEKIFLKSTEASNAETKFLIKLKDKKTICKNSFCCNKFNAQG